MNLIENRPERLLPEYDALARMERTSARAIETLKASTKGTFDAIWNNPKIPPARMLEIMGNRAKKGFIAHAAAIAALRAADVDTSGFDTPPLAYTIHDNGTITLNHA
jgi:hypothetical protein